MTTGPEPAAVEFTGSRKYLFGLALKNSLLSLLTLGIYRFWGKTRIRRYFWSNVRIGGEPLEYTGLPSELLIGFLIALAVLVPLYGIYESMEFFFSGNTAVEQAAQTVYVLTLLFFFQYAFYRMWRYRLTRTVWRGIRFGLGGSAAAYASRAMGWSLLAGLTFGIAYPWMRVSLVQYIWRNARFGQRHFDMQASGARLVVPWLLIEGTVVLLTGLAIWQLALAVGDLGKFIDSGTFAAQALKDLWQMGIRPIAILAGELVGVFLIGGSLFVWYRIREFRYLSGCLHFGTATLASSARAWRVFGLVVATVTAVMAGVLVVDFVIGSTVIVSIVVAYAPTFRDVRPTTGNMITLGVAVAVGTIVTTQILNFIIFRFGMVAHLCRTLSITDLGPFERALQSRDATPDSGEGLADALDVGAF